MRYDNKKIVFSNNAKSEVAKAKDKFSYVEAGVITIGEINNDKTREAFIKLCDEIEASLEHIKSEVINGGQ